MRRVVITGMGMVSPLGNTLESSWESLKLNKSGISKYINDPVIKNSEPLNLSLVKDFDYKKWGISHANSRQNCFVNCVAEEAINNSNLEIEKCDKERVAIVLGVIASNNSKISEFLKESSSSNFSNINRLSLLHLITSIPTGFLNIKYKLRGPSLTVNTACASGLSAVIQAAKYIKENEADVVLAGGVEDSYNPLEVNSCLRIKAMTKEIYEKPENASCPFDKKRSGFVLGEGSGMFIIEELEHALKRNAKIYGEILGYGEGSDGYHLVKPNESGIGQILSMKKALKKAEIPVEEITFVDCHATSTPLGDEIEARSISEIFGSSKPYITANKSYIGHTLGAAGSIELMFAIKSLNSSFLPKINNLENPDVELNYVKENVSLKSSRKKYFLKNSFGFGGINVSIVIGEYN